jgi:hypothetical protein
MLCFLAGSAVGAARKGMDGAGDGGQRWADKIMLKQDQSLEH